jgi:hypothetical protein
LLYIANQYLGKWKYNVIPGLTGNLYQDTLNSTLNS